MTTPRGTPAATAFLICSSEICGFVWNTISSGTPAVFATQWIFRPRLRQIETVANWQTCVCVCNRKTYGNLTIRLLPELPAILMRHTYGVLAFLGHVGVIDNPDADGHTLLDYRND